MTRTKLDSSFASFTWNLSCCFSKIVEHPKCFAHRSSSWKVGLSWDPGWLGVFLSLSVCLSLIPGPLPLHMPSLYAPLYALSSRTPTQVSTSTKAEASSNFYVRPTTGIAWLLPHATAWIKKLTHPWSKEDDYWGWEFTGDSQYRGLPLVSLFSLWHLAGSFIFSSLESSSTSTTYLSLMGINLSSFTRLLPPMIYYQLSVMNS